MDNVQRIKLSEMTREAYKDFFANVLYPIDGSYEMHLSCSYERESDSLILKVNVLKEDSDEQELILIIEEDTPHQVLDTFHKVTDPMINQKQSFKDLWNK